MGANTKPAKPERDELVLELRQAKRPDQHKSAHGERGPTFAASDSLVAAAALVAAVPSIGACTISSNQSKGAARHKTIREAERQPGRQREGQEDIERGSERDSQRQRDSERGRATARETITRANVRISSNLVN